MPKNTRPDMERDNKQTDRLIQYLFSEKNIPANELEEMRKWLMEETPSDPENEALRKMFDDEALWPMFVEMYTYKEKSSYAHLLWPKIAKRLQMDVNLIDDHRTKAMARACQPERRLIPRTLFRVAAVLIPLLVIGTTLSLWVLKTGSIVTDPLATDPIAVVTPGSENSEKQDSTEIVVTENETLMLPDHSVIRLSKGGELHYAKHFEHNRKVELTGEAHFNVTPAADEADHFVVQTPHFKIAVLGTEFEVKSPAGERFSSIDLYHGKIQVEVAGQSVIMIPGDHLDYDHESGTIERRKIAIGQRIYDRMSGLAEGGPLHDIFHTINEEYNIPVNIAGTLPELHIRADLSGARTADELMGILKTLTGAFTYEIMDHQIHIKPND